MAVWKKILIGVTGTLIVLITAIIILSYYLLRKTLPIYDGSLSISGISSQVKVLRDSFAVPMIIAQNDEDAAFTLGYVHAQERLFQMDISRRAGEGRLSEIFGSNTIPFDKMFRTIGIYRNVEENYSRLNPLTKKILNAYSKGVNAYIRGAKGKYQVEFDILGYDPYPWKPEHSLVIAKLMAWELNISWWVDISFAKLIQKLGEDKAKELLPDFPQNAPTIIPGGLSSTGSIPSDFIKVDRDFRRFVGFVGTHIGSNNWVVNANKSVSGKPIIANDPHLTFSAPGKWYFAIIRSDDWNVEGFTIPGLPAIVIGKNKNISWAMTNVMADDADFYIEQFDSTGKNYFFNGQWNSLSIKKDSFEVKNSANYVFEMRSTHRGPIISDVHPYNILYPKAAPKTVNLSMRWTGLEFSDELFGALSINKANNWESFKEGLKYFTVPGQNFVYGDNKGNIGYICAAKLPMRNSTSPTLVYDGTTDKNDWKGFVPYDEMPKLINPQQNYIASANNKTVENFSHHISNIWEPSSRIDRITGLLSSKKLYSVDDFKKYQMDLQSPYAKMIVPYILTAFKSAKVNDKNLKLALELFYNWDFVFNAESQVPTIYTRFLQHFLKNTLKDELGDDLLQEYVFVANIPYRIILKFLKSDSVFFDDLSTNETESRDDIIRKSLVDALNELEKLYGSKIANWQWGNIHKVTFKHMFNGVSGLLDKYINIGPFSIGGDGTTIFNTEYSFNRLFAKEDDSKNSLSSQPYENILGPSMRYIFDFANPDYLEFILPTGQSGNIISDHYMDMTQMWLKGKYIRLSLTEERFGAAAKHKLELLPK